MPSQRTRETGPRHVLRSTSLNDMQALPVAYDDGGDSGFKMS